MSEAKGLIATHFVGGALPRVSSEPALYAQEQIHIWKERMSKEADEYAVLEEALHKKRYELVQTRQIVTIWEQELRLLLRGKTDV